VLFRSEYVLNNINTETQNGQWEMLINSLSSASNIRQLPLKTVLVQLELLKVLKPMYSYFAEFKFKFLQPVESILNRFTGERYGFIKAIFDSSKMKKVWSHLDFDDLYQSYKTERARVVVALEYLQEKSLIELETKRMTEVYEVDQNALKVVELAGKLHTHFAEKEKAEIKRMVDDLIEKHGPGAEHRACINEHAEWRDSHAYKQGFWRRVRRELQRRHRAGEWE